MIHPQFGDLFFEKYHPLVKGMSVAFETTFSVNTNLKYSFDGLSGSGITEKSFKTLIHRRDRETVQRVYNPAYRTKIIPTNTYGFLFFVPFVEEGEALFHRVCLRYKNYNPNQRVFLARLSEEKVFTFQSVKTGDCAYISLNFLGKGATEFEDIYIKMIENGNIYYYKVSVRLAEEGVVMMTDRVEESSSPPHLQIAE